MKNFINMMQSFKSAEIKHSDTLRREAALAEYGELVRKRDGAIKMKLTAPIIINNKILVDDKEKFENLSLIDDSKVLNIRSMGRRKVKKLTGKGPNSNCIIVESAN